MPMFHIPTKPNLSSGAASYLRPLQALVHQSVQANFISPKSNRFFGTWNAGEPPRVITSLTGSVGRCRPKVLSVVERNEGSGVLRTDVLGARADQAVVGILFEYVCGPTGHPTDSKDRREQLYRNAEQVVRRG